MYFQSLDNLGNLEDKLSMIEPQDLQSMLSVPGFDQFSQSFSGMLPNNFIGTGAGGVQDLMNPTNLTNKLGQNLQQVMPQVGQQLTGQLKGITGAMPSNFSGSNMSQQASQLGTKLKQKLEEYSKKSSDQMLQLFQQNVQTGQLSNLVQAAQGGMGGSSFSPSSIKKLADPANFNSTLNNFTQNSQNNIAGVATGMAQQQASNPVFNNSGQQNFQQMSLPKFSGDNSNGFNLTVRRTVYWAQGSGTDSDSAAMRSSTGRRLAQGISAAVDPALIPYLSRLQFDDIGDRVAVDTGGAVKARVASGGAYPIIDIFYVKKEEALAAAASMKPIVTVRVIPPASTYKYAANSSPTYGVA